MLCPLPQQAGKESGLKRCPGDYLLIRNDLIDQKEHPKREEEWNDIFQGESDQGSELQRRLKAKTITLEVNHHRSECHTRQVQGPHQEDHKKVNGDSPDDPPAFFNMKDNVEGRPQGAEYPYGSPDQPPTPNMPTIFRSRITLKMFFITLGSNEGATFSR